ncbi:MAG: DNA polymerase [Proteobacteria bacterium]|nr:MAG: DNA polymerase [Pseudomonadota bacterium]PIE19002.1 MAG: DNA polymerase [Pseudomonadota bacterium]
MTEDERREELAALVGTFAEHLRRGSRRGLRWVSAGPSPRVLDDEAGAALAASPEAPAVEAEVAQPERAIGRSLAPPIGANPEALRAVREQLGDCQRCRLAGGRQHLVFGAGSAEADLMIVGEAPGRDEDRLGEPFVGAAGQLLTKMLAAMGLERGDVYITNILKCRPPQNRNPEPEEVEACEPFLRKQIDAIGPRILLAMGNFAAKTLLRTTTGITRLRGTFYAYHGIPVMPTFHPAYLLRNADGKRPAWKDLQAVMAEMDRLGLYRRRDR